VRVAARIVVTLIAAHALGCTAHYLVNPPLERWDPDAGYRDLVVRAERPGTSSSSLDLMLAFSGGGTRAAAFAYGVLEELAVTQVELDGRRRRLADEVDFVAGVSGGSFTAAYFGLHGDGIFEHFEERFLKRDVQGALMWRVFAPWNWVKLASRRYGTGDLAAEYYDKEIFDGATFADLRRGAGPFVEVTATDLGAGSPFSYVQDQFDFICSDVSKYPVAWAVAASAAVPGVFNPLTLENFSGTCGFEPPEWLDQALRRRGGYDRLYLNAQTLNSYFDPGRNYIRMVDGGISDNLAIRGPFEGSIAKRAELGQRPPEFAGSRHVVLISVNSAVTPKAKWEREGWLPNLASVLFRSSGVQIQRYNVETIELARSIVRSWNAAGASWSPSTRFHLVELDFARVEDPEERAYLNSLPTSLSLDSEAVDRLRVAGGELLRESEAFQRLLAALGGAVPGD
jgi:NTE family protein